MPTHQTHNLTNTPSGGLVKIVKLGYVILGLGLIYFSFTLANFYLTTFTLYFWYRFISHKLFPEIALFVVPKNKYYIETAFLAITVFNLAYYLIADLEVLSAQTNLSLFLLFFGYYTLDQIQLQKNSFSSSFLVEGLPMIGFLLLGATQLVTSESFPIPSLMMYMSIFLSLYIVIQTFKPPANLSHLDSQESLKEETLASSEDHSNHDEGEQDQTEPGGVDYQVLPDSIAEEIKDLPSVEEIQTLVSVPDEDKTVIAMVVVSNTITQERMFDTKQKVRKILQDNDYPESVIELMYKIEYEKLG
jgi:hypothetical protein